MIKCFEKITDTDTVYYYLKKNLCVPVTLKHDI